MGWADPDVLEARVRGLDSEGLVAFVAGLWTARGFETDRDGASVVARRGGETRVVYVVTGGVAAASVETDRRVDVVVAAGRPRAGAAVAAESNARFVDAAGLVEMLRYAVDRAVAATLCERHLGAAPDELRFPPRHRVRRAVARRNTETVVTVIVALLVVAVGGGAVLGVTDPGGTGGGSPAEAVVTPETVTSPAGASPTTVTVDDGSVPTGAGVGDLAAVPGVSDTGISNASRLAQAHAGTVAGTSSYTIWFDHYTAENGSTGHVKRDVNVRVDAERIAVQTIREGTGGTRSPARTSYFDGTDRYVAANVTDELSRVDNRTPAATPLAVPFTRPGDMVRVYLATPESTVSAAASDGAGERYRLQGSGRPAGLPDTVSEYEMTAVVDERGFVRTLDAEFTVARDTDAATDRKRVRLTWTYDRINGTEIGLDP